MRNEEGEIERLLGTCMLLSECACVERESEQERASKRERERVYRITVKET